jgi:hypothetical protein
MSESGKRLFTSLDDLIAALPDEDRVGDEDWDQIPVPLEKWLYDPEYMNLDVTLSKIQIDFLESMDDPNPETNKYTEFVAEWGKGSGKDFVSALGGLRQAYFLLCMRNPYTFYGLAKNTGIQLVNVAYTKDQAKFVYFKQLKGLLRGSPWFIRRGFTLTRERVTFDHDIEFVSTSADGDSVEGQNIFFAVMDEASAFKDANMVKARKAADGVKVDRAADAIYKVLRTSSRSRFPSIGKVVIISYPRYINDFTQVKRKENENSEHGFTSGPYATWEVNPRIKQEDLAEDYRKDPETAAAMYECKPPFAEDGYIKFPHRFIECISASVKLGIKSPIFSDGTYDSFFKGEPGRLYAIHVDLALRKDRCALSLARQGEPIQTIKCPCNKWNFPGVEVCTECGKPKERWVKIDLPTMVVTLLKSFAPRENASGSKEVDFSDVRDEILYLRDRGHKMFAVSYDGWQSQDSIQMLQKVFGERTIKDRWGKELRTEQIACTLSVDRNTEAHDTLKEFIYDGRFFIAPPEDIMDVSDWETSDDPVAVAYREWRALRLINAKKIDHPLGGSKDYVDALAGCAYWIGKMPMARVRMPSISGWSETPTIKRR